MNFPKGPPNIAPNSPPAEYPLSSPQEEETDTGILSGPNELEPQPGLGAPVRWFDADRTQSYAKIEPFLETNDTSVEFVFKPITLTVLFCAIGLLAYVGMSTDVLEEGRSKQRLGIYAAIAGFLLFSMIQFRDGPFIRPHPAFWRIVLGINLIYELAMVFLLFQDLNTARGYMVLLDSNLGVPLPEKNYAEDCSLSWMTIWNALDIFCVAHALGWFGKALILRDYWFCWILSIAFEFAEYSLEHQLANFGECWWDHWVLDVLLCNWLGTYVGMKTCQYLEVKHFSWQNIRPFSFGSSKLAMRRKKNESIDDSTGQNQPTTQTVPDSTVAKKPKRPGAIRRNTKRVLKQFSPHDFTKFEWAGTSSFTAYFTVVLLLSVFLAAELSPFYLKFLLWMEPSHPFVVARLVGVFLCGLPAVRELYQYMNDSRRAVRMGQHTWLLLSTICTELLVIIKWSRGQFPEPMPGHIKVFLGTISVLLVVYPTVKFGVPEARRYLLRDRKSVV